MPSLSPSLLGEWLQHGAVGTGLARSPGLMMGAFRGLEARIDQRISQPREDLKAREVKTERKAEPKAMNDRLDQVLESLLVVKTS
ncbi:MAG: hypothetical protein TH68_05400 [Candidatus Synechococcus spongiarum 142]|uniref:Uncharacterized protein n=1 Tax=Candidatus Synechococcus spongiarum 142 TaxID=1608213 RepID=A0A6N3XB25_9SYNE|nr:MAG: hypothetical protein TH68_05400 [Candidatus Synechococcus spongiarum 142]